MSFYEPGLKNLEAGPSVTSRVDTASHMCAVKLARMETRHAFHHGLDHSHHHGRGHGLDHDHGQDLDDGLGHGRDCHGSLQTGYYKAGNGIGLPKSSILGHHAPLKM